MNESSVKAKIKTVVIILIVMWVIIFVSIAISEHMRNSRKIHFIGADGNEKTMTVKGKMTMYCADNQYAHVFYQNGNYEGIQIWNNAYVDKAGTYELSNEKVAIKAGDGAESEYQIVNNENGDFLEIGSDLIKCQK